MINIYTRIRVVACAISTLWRALHRSRARYVVKSSLLSIYFFIFVDFSLRSREFL